MKKLLFTIGLCISFTSCAAQIFVEENVWRSRNNVRKVAKKRIGQEFTITYDSIQVSKHVGSDLLRRTHFHVLKTVNRSSVATVVSLDTSAPVTYTKIDSQKVIIITNAMPVSSDTFISLNKTPVVGINRDAPPDLTGYPITTETQPVEWSRRGLIDYYRRHHIPRWFVDVGDKPGWAGRILRIRNASIRPGDVDIREQKEGTIFGNTFRIQTGLLLNGANDAIYVAFCRTNGGFVSRMHDVDLVTGLPVTNAIDEQKYLFDYTGGELGYTYSPFSKRVGFTFDSALNLMVLTSMKSSGVNKFAWGITISPGVKFRLAHFLDLRVAPSMNLNLNSVKGEKINTGFYSLGLQAGLRVYMGKI
jgi:hypothetical protein